MALKQPVSQKRLTNVAIVKYKSHGIKFEIACYKNKVLNWREGVEKNLDEVLQTTSIFTNVSKGIWAKEVELKKAFGTTDEEEICKLILTKGELQVSEKEREVYMDSLARDVASVVCEKCVNPKTKLPLTVGMIETMMKDAHISVKPNQPAKKQALQVIEALQKKGAQIARAQMRLRLVFPDDESDRVDAVLKEMQATLEKDNGAVAAGFKCSTFVCDPSHYRQLDTLKGQLGTGAQLQIVTQAVHGDSSTAMQGPQTSINGPGDLGPLGAPAPISAYPSEREKRSSVTKKDEKGEKKGPTCSTCQFGAADAAEYRAHCKSEWHVHNLQRKVKQLAPLSQEEFREMDVDEAAGFLAVD